MSVTNGQIANATTFNNAFLSRTTDSDTVGVVGLKNTSDPLSGTIINNTQRMQNELADTVGQAGEGDVNRKVYSSNNVVANGDNRKVAIGKLDAKFDSATGHAHDGTAGNGAPVSAADLSDLNYYKATWQTFLVSPGVGLDDDVSVQLTGKTPGGATATAGVITSAPYNKVEIRDASLDTYIEDAGGQRVYGRITESAGVWTLTYFTNESGVETAHTLASTNIRVFFLEVFTLDMVPTIPDEAGFIGSLDLTADVVDAGASQRGVVSTGTQTFGGLKTIQDGLVVSTRWTTPKFDVASAATINALTYRPFVKITGATATQINGIASGADGNRIIIHNETSETVTIANEDGAASAADRFQLPQSKNILLKPTSSAAFIYNSDESRWVVQTAVGSGSGSGSGSGGVNLGVLAELNVDAEVNVDDWTGFDDAGANYVDGTGGSPTGFTLTRTTTAGEILNGLASFELSKDAVNRQGRGWSFDVPVPLGYRGQPGKLNFTMQVSANYAPGDVEMYLFDVTNSRIIVPTPNSLDLPGGQKDIIQQFFYIPYDCEDLRASFFVASTSALAYDIQFDDFGVLAIEALQAGPIVTDLQSYTPTFTGFGTPSNVEFVWSQKGDSIVILGKFTSGTPTATEARISLPDSFLSSGTDKIPTIRMIGSATYDVPYDFDLYVLIEPSVGYVTFGIQDVANAGLSKLNGTGVVAVGETISFVAEIPILGLTSGSTRIIDLPTKKVIATAEMSGVQSIADATFTTVIFDTTNEDTDGQYDNATGEFTVKYPGDIEIKGALLFDTNATGTRSVEVVDGSNVRRKLLDVRGALTGADTLVTMSATIESCVPGDILKIRVMQNSGGNLDVGSGTPEDSYVSFTRVNDRTQITPAAEVVVELSLSANTTPGAGNALIYDTVDSDLTGMYDTVTGRFYGYKPGFYMVAVTHFSSTPVAGDLQLWKNGALLKRFNYTGDAFAHSGAQGVRLESATDYFDLRPDNGSTFGGIVDLNCVSVVKVAN